MHALLALVLTLWGAPAQAAPLTCELITNMVDAHVPTNIIVQVVGDAGAPVTDETARCLTEANVAPEIVAAALSAPVVPDGAPPSPAETPPPPEPPEPPLAPDTPERLVAAVDALHHGKTRAASTTLAEVIRLRQFPGHEAKSHFYLGQTLEELGFPNAAGRRYLEALKAGPDDPYFPYALARLTRVSVAIGDTSDLARIVATLPPEAFPRACRAELFYQLGLRMYEREKLTEARKYLDQVGEGSEHFYQARYLIGVIYSTQGKLKSGVRAFAEIVAAYETPEEGAPRPSRELRDHAQLRFGEVYYSLEDFERATTWFALPTDSPLYAQGQLRLAWTRFMLGDSPLEALDVLERRPATWLPEAALLRALDAFQKVHHTEVLEQTAALVAELRPVHAAMRALLATTSSEAAAAEVWRRLADPRQKELPPNLVAHLLRDHELQGLARRLDALDREARAIRRQPKGWRDSVGVALLGEMAEDRARFEQRAGQVLLGRLGYQAAYVADLLYQAKVLRFEAADALEEDGMPSTVAALPLLRELLAETPAWSRSEVRLRLAAKVPDAEAVPLWEQILAEDPQYARADEALYQLGLADPSRQVANLTRLTTLYPESRRVPDACVYLGEHAFVRREFAAAVGFYRRAAAYREHPWAGFAHYKLGWALYGAGDHAGAVEALAAVPSLTKDPTLLAVAAAERAKMMRGR